MSPFPPVSAAPVLLDHLLGLMFVVHVVFMNFVLAAPLVMVWNLWSGNDDKRRFAQWLAGALPVAFTFTITLGVAALLFVQALFPDRFYTANILLGKIWLAVIPLLMAAFYAAYVARSLVAKPKGSVWAGLACLVTAALTSCIVVIMVSNYFATTMAERWPELAVKSALVLLNQTFLPRTLHFMAGAFAVTGLWMVWISWWKRRRGEDAAACTAFRRQGLHLAAGASGAQVIAGVWFLIWLPAEAWDRLFNGSVPSLVWISGVATGLALLGVLIVATVYPDRPLWSRVATALMAWTLLGMAAGRGLLRLFAFDRAFQVASIEYRTQAGAMLVFFVLLLIGLATLAALIWLIWRLPPAGGDSRSD
ncbi:MAG: hypothetical protein NT025_02825 [bacterium]|nr:hypothetical protein [bacterium]